MGGEGVGRTGVGRYLLCHEGTSRESVVRILHVVTEKVKHTNGKSCRRETDVDISELNWDDWEYYFKFLNITR